MHLSMWTYPWDVQDLSHDKVAEELAGAGLNTVSLAASYHAGRFLQPRSPRRKAYFPEDGTLYFKPTPARWEGLAIQPKLADVIRDGGDVLGELVRRRDAGGLGVSCWTVCLHNTRIGMRHPEVATRNAFGDPSYFSLCPSHPDARAYVTTLVEDLSHAYRPDIIELESPSFMGFVHGYHHEKDGVGLTAEDDFLLSLCFCDACLARAARSGIDGRRGRERVRRWIAETCEREVPQPRWPDFPAAGLDVFKPYPDLHDYLMWRFEPVTSLIAAMRERTHPGTRLYLIDLKDGWLGGCDLAAAGGACDGLILCAYDMSPPQVAALLRSGREAVGPGKFVGAGFRVFYPEMQGAADLVERVHAAAMAGADGLNFYNYGLVPQARLGWVRQAIAAAAAAHGD